MITRTRIGHSQRGWRLAFATFAVALAAAAYGTAQAQTPPGPGPGMGMGMHGGPGMGHGPGMGPGAGMGWGQGPAFGGGFGPGLHDRMLEAAGASADQKAKIRDIFVAMRKDLRTQADAGRAMHQQLSQALLAPAPDAAAVENLRRQMLAQHDTASKRMAQAMLDASAVLTPEQRTKLAQSMQQRREMFERHRRERQSIDPQRG